MNVAHARHIATLSDTYFWLGYGLFAWPPSMNRSFFPLVNIQSELFAIRLNVGSLYVVIMQIGKGSIHAGLTFYLFGLQNLDQCHGFVCPPINAHITTLNTGSSVLQSTKLDVLTTICYSLKLKPVCKIIPKTSAIAQLPKELFVKVTDHSDLKTTLLRH